MIAFFPRCVALNLSNVYIPRHWCSPKSSLCCISLLPSCQCLQPINQISSQVGVTTCFVIDPGVSICPFLSLGIMCTPKWKVAQKGMNPSYQFIRPFMGVITPCITSRGPTLYRTPLQTIFFQISSQQKCSKCRCMSLKNTRTIVFPCKKQQHLQVWYNPRWLGLILSIWLS